LGVHLLAIGDIGPIDDMIHLGDEAMFDEAVRQLRHRGVARITGVSSNPRDSAERYGIEAVRPLGRDAMTDEEALDTELGAALRSTDAVLVTGGGNISSVWPTHIVERARLARLAQRLQIPFVVSGQTIGPVLSDDDRDEVGRMLGSARLVGTRERPSFELVRRLGVDPARLAHTIDDASFLGAENDTSDVPSTPVALVSFARHVGDADPDTAAHALAGLLDTVAEVTGLQIVFLAHFASLRPDEPRGDTLMHQRIIDRMRSTRVRVEATTDAPAAARLARTASLVVSSRYHPAVFAASGAVPTIGIPVDTYTDVKLRGALGAVGHDGILPLEQLVIESPVAWVSDLWSRRDAVRAGAEERLIQARAASVTWWDRVHEALGER
jgi:polysaccharide pyruvyl transferase WcaK-like protein